jgi:hypothetical protein
MRNRKKNIFDYLKYTLHFTHSTKNKKKLAYVQFLLYLCNRKYQTAQF